LKAGLAFHTPATEEADRPKKETEACRDGYPSSIEEYRTIIKG